MAELLAAAASIEKLPPEILKLILSNLDEKELLTCRLVKRSWKFLGNEILREKSTLWNDTFGSVYSSEFEYSRYGFGSRFSTPGEITSFIKEMGGVTNPFPNGTVIFIPDDELEKNQLVAFHTNFCKLLSAFYDSILKLVYFIPVSMSTEITVSRQFLAILKLKKLRTLAIEKCWDWGHEKTLRSRRSQRFARKMESTLPEMLQELQIHGWNGVIPLFYLFGGREATLKSVSSLDIYNKVGGPGHQSNPRDFQRFDLKLCQFPNLQKLKVRYPDPEFLKQFQQFQPNCVKRLKEISFYFDFYHDKGGELTVELNLKEIFELVDLHEETLELLHLDFGSSEMLQPDNSVFNSTGLFTPVKYPKLKTFVLQYHRIDPWPPGISQLMAKFVNLQEFKISLPYHERKLSWEQFKKVGTFWDRIPATVKVITCLERGWKVKRGETLQEEG